MKLDEIATGGGICLGFTGSRAGLTEPQRVTLQCLIKMLKPTLAIHGDCVGADALFHAMVRRLAPSAFIVALPCNLNRYRANCDAEFIAEPTPPLDRNRAIVDATTKRWGVMLATPNTLTIQQRGGTWYTAKYANAAFEKSKMPTGLFIVLPDGRVTDFNPIIVE